MAKRLKRPSKPKSRAKVSLGATAVLKSKVITLTRSFATASGDISYTGVGFRPIALIAFGSQANGSPVTFLGIVDSALECQNLNTATTHDVTARFLVLGSGGHDQTAIVKSYDADGFTLTWTKTGFPGGPDASIAVLCLG
jgi:hypothetical protein